MKLSTGPVYDAIRNAKDVTALPRLIANWNMNRYVPVIVTNTPSEDTDGYDIEIFPIESITKPDRPTKGICKALVNQSRISGGYINPDEARFYTGSVDDKYKYWISPTVSDAGGNITGVSPQVVYGVADATGVVTTQNVDVNKIVVKFESSWATPVEYTVSTTTNGTNWNIVSTNPPVADDGSVVLYWNGTAWSTNEPATVQDNLKTICGVRLDVTQLGGGTNRTGEVTKYTITSDVDSTGDLAPTQIATDGSNSSFALIELATYLEVDLTPYVMTVEDTFDTSDVSQLYPIGSLTANTATVTLWNGHEDTITWNGQQKTISGSLFSKDNPNSPFANLMEANVEMNLEYVYQLDGGPVAVQQFFMYSQQWSGQAEDTVSLSLSDFSAQLGATTPLPALYENLPLPDIVYRICDAVGFNKYNIVKSPAVTDYKIPVFWMDGQKTVWEVFDELAKATQSAIYFDCWGVLNIKTRDAAFDPTRTTDWTLLGESGPGGTADIIEVTQNEDFEQNVIKVSYQATDWSDWNGGLPAMQTVWQPESDTVLRSSILQVSLSDGDVPTDGSNMFFKVDPVEASTWPYSGHANIEGEIIKFDGKRFIYYSPTYAGDGSLETFAGQMNVVIVHSDDEFKQYNEILDVGWRQKNYFDGNIVITERGSWNTERVAHLVDVNQYSVHGNVDGVNRDQMLGFNYHPTESMVDFISSTRMETGDDINLATHGTINDQGWTRVGTQMTFIAGANHSFQRAGIVFNNGSGMKEDGYYIELLPSNLLTGSLRQSRNELLIYVRKDGKIHYVNGIGAKLAVAEGIPYTIDVSIYAGVRIRVWVNGRFITDGSVDPDWQLTPNGRFGMFIRGKTRAQFEYLYGVGRDVPDPPDDFTWLNKVNGAYEGELFTREWVYDWVTKTRIVKKKSTQFASKKTSQYMDEFGPYVHEIREFSVDFDPNPVLHSRLFSTNDWNACCIGYSATPFNAKFAIANVGRQNAVLQGDDTLENAGSDTPVSQQLSVIGRTLVVADAVTIERRNEQQIQARGESESTLDSTWIQSEAAANALADWMAAHWSGGIDSLTVTVFGNPLVEIGDVLAIDYPDKNMTPAESRYFVTGAATTFDSGLATTLTLRRVAH